jgi:ribosomal protein L37AE/L43A
MSAELCSFEPSGITLATLQEADRDLGARFCRSCGCTDSYGCDAGCWWVDEDLCSVCSKSQAALELPEYPPLPVVEGRLMLEMLEEWRLLRDRRSAELDVAMVLAVEAGATDDRQAIVGRMAEFELRRTADREWVCGYMVGRTRNAFLRELGIEDGERCPHCGAANIDRGATGLDQCNICSGLSRAGRALDDVSEAWLDGHAAGKAESVDRLEMALAHLQRRAGES